MTSVSFSLSERRRREAAIEQLMKTSGVDALIVYSRGETNRRGRVFYACGAWQLTGESFYVAVATGEPFFVTTPLVGLDEAQASCWISDLRLRQDPAAEIAAALKDRKPGAIGIVGLIDSIPFQVVDHLKTTLPDARLCDLTREFDRLRRVKAPEETDKLRDTSRVMRQIFDDLAEAIRPGVEERQVLGQLVRLGRDHGCRDVLAYMATSPFQSYTYGSNRKLEVDSSIVVWLEAAGPSGYWLEFNRCYSFGPPTPPAQRAWQIQVESFNAALGSLTRDTPTSQLVNTVDTIYKAYGFAAPIPPSPYLAHGIGTDTVEDLWLPGGDDRVFEEGEIISLHPFMQFAETRDAEAMASICVTDNVRVTAQGGEPLTDTDHAWIVL